MKTNGKLFFSISILILAVVSGAFAGIPASAAAQTATTSQGSISDPNLSASTSTSSTSDSIAPSSSDQISPPKLLRDSVTIDLNDSYLVVSKTYPVNVTAVISGWLPDPCHILQVAVKPALTANTIDIDVYSLFDPTQGCIDVVEPFTTKVSLGSFDRGEYIVYVNGMKLDGFTVSKPITTTIADTTTNASTSSSTVADTTTSASPSTSSTSDSISPSSSDQFDSQKLVRDGVTLDLKNSYLVLSKTYPVNVTAVISGWLPDPCHILQVALKPSLTRNTIDIDVYSLFDPTQECITVEEPFATKVSLGSFYRGEYIVHVNGIKLDGFGVSLPSLTDAAPATRISTSSSSTFFAMR